MEELIDLCDADGNSAGRTKVKDEAHRDGDWHRAAHLWIVTPDGGIVLQLRASVKDNFPDLWDVSVAGHVSAGESSREAAVREALEEIGLPLDPSQLRLIASLRQQVVLHDGRYLDNELHEVFVVVHNVELSALTLQREEVSAVRIVSADELRTMLACDAASLVPHPGEYELLLAYVEALPR